MAVNKQLLEKARRLGAEMASEPAVRAFLVAKQALDESKEVNDLIRDREQHAKKVAELSQAGKAVEPGDKRKLQEAEVELSRHPIIKELTRRQADYLEVTQAVQRAMNEALAEAAGVAGQPDA